MGGDANEMASSFRQQWHKKKIPKSEQTPCFPMNKYLENTTHVDFFSLDVEGAELTVIETIDFNKVTIDTFIIEFDMHNQQKNYKIRQYLFNLGYIECIGAIHRSAMFLHKQPSDSSYKCPGASTNEATCTSIMH